MNPESWNIRDGRDPEGHQDPHFMGEGIKVKQGPTTTQLVRGRGKLGAWFSLFKSMLSTIARQLPSLPLSFMQKVIVGVRHSARCCRG